MTVYQYIINNYTNQAHPVIKKINNDIISDVKCISWPVYKLNEYKFVLFTKM